jgi:hypothetical protein
MDTERIEKMLRTEWPQERDSRVYLPADLGTRQPLQSSVQVRARSPFRLGAGAAALVLLIVAGTVITGAWLHLQTTPGPSPTATPTASPSASVLPTESPSIEPSESFFDPWTTYSFRPSPQSSPVAIAGNATVDTRSRTGTDEASNLQWDFWQPLIATPGRSAGAAIDANVEALLDSRVAELNTDFGDPGGGGPPEHTVTLITTFTVISSAGPQADPSAGFLTIRIDYTWNNPPWADAGPQWIDFLSYDLATGKRISISNLFTNTSTALKRLSAAAGADPVILEGADPTGYEPTPESFAMWAPTRTGLEITFAVNQVSAAAAGTPAFTLPWSQLHDLVEPNSYLAWYLAQAPSSGPSHGTFGLSGSMLTAEQSPSAILLKNGRVLVMGLRAELYDPGTGAFSATGPLPNARYGRSATRLRDGRVLVAGGTNVDRSEFDDSAEIYDPQTGKFTATGWMATGRAYHTATLLDDGRVLIAGGDNAVSTINGDGSTSPAENLAAAEIYDPQTGKFTATGWMATGRAYHTATLLAGGRVLIAGGSAAGYWYSSDSVLPSAEIYDPTTGTFTASGSMTSARSSHTATKLNDGRVLIAGGDTTGASAELYDPATRSFSAAGSMGFTRYGLSATLLGDGRVLFVGGGNALAEIYDPQTGTLSATGSMVLARYGTSAVLLQDNRVLVVGGESTGGASAEIYQP